MHKGVILKLFTPGPVELHPRILQAMSKQMISHRSNEFRRLFSEITEMLKSVYLTDEGEVLLITGSGTMAVDSMIYSLVNPGDRTLLLTFGEFGERILKTLTSRECKVDIIRKEYGDSVRLDDVEEVIDRGNYKALFAVYNETSTGAKLRDIEAIAKKAKEKGILVCIDAISALAGEPLYMDKWGLDAVASCSHKCIGGPPGISFIALSKEASRIIYKTKSKPPYLDLSKYLEFAKRKETPFTPAISVIYGLQEALRMLHEEGLKNRWKRLAKLSHKLYMHTKLLGFKQFPREDTRSNTIVALEPPNGISASQVTHLLLKQGIVIARGMGDLKERIVRIGVMGYINDNDINHLINAIKNVVEEIKGE